MSGKVDQKCLDKQCHEILLFANNVVIAARLKSDLQHAFYLFSSDCLKTGIKESMGKTEHIATLKPDQANLKVWQKL